MTWNTLTTWGPMYGQLSQDWAVAHDLMHFQIMTPTVAPQFESQRSVLKAIDESFTKKMHQIELK